MDVIGSVLLAPDTGTLTYFSPWFSRGGNLVYVQCDVIDTDGLGGFTMDVETKNSEEGDDGAEKITSGTTITLTNGTRTEVEAGANLGDNTADSGLKELVRLVYNIQGNGSNNGGYVHFRILNLSWLSN